MTNEEKAQKLAEEHENATSFGIESPYHAALGAAIDMAEWKDEQIAEAKELLHLCYNTILGITSLDSPEEIAKARKSHNSSLIKRIESFMYNNQ